MNIVAYKERESQDPYGTESGILRDEWRVLRVSDYAPGVLEEHFGPQWRRSRPFAEFVLEHRYIRRGREEPWTPFDAANTYEQALQYIDDKAIAIDPILLEIQEARAEHARQQMEEEESRRLADLEEEERRYRKKRSAEAFARLMEGRSRPWGERWNEFIDRHMDDDAFKEWAQANERFMQLYSAVFAAYTVPAKVKAIRELLKEFGDV